MCASWLYVVVAPLCVYLHSLEFKWSENVATLKENSIYLGFSR